MLFLFLFIADFQTDSPSSKFGGGSIIYLLEFSVQGTPTTYVSI